jgi:hypothetical protein
MVGRATIRTKKAKVPSRIASSIPIQARASLRSLLPVLDVVLKLGQNEGVVVRAGPDDFGGGLLDGVEERFGVDALLRFNLVGM